MFCATSPTPRAAWEMFRDISLVVADCSSTHGCGNRPLPITPLFSPFSSFSDLLTSVIVLTAFVSFAPTDSNRPPCSKSGASALIASFPLKHSRVPFDVRPLLPLHCNYEFDL